MGETKKDYEHRKSTIKRAKKVKRIIKLVLLYVFMVIFCVTGVWLTVVIYDRYKKGDSSNNVATQSQTQSTVSVAQSNVQFGNVQLPEGVSAQVIDVGATRTGAKLSDFTGIIIHFVGDPSVDADARREYYASQNAAISTHFVVGTDGKVIMCLPLDEQAFGAAAARNADTISIEYCHTTYDGLMSGETYDSLVNLCAAILRGTGKGSDYLLRHYDINKEAQCPSYYISHSDAWNKFKADVEAKMA